MSTITVSRSKEKGDDIVFLRKIVKGGADKELWNSGCKACRSVRSLVIDRAKEIVEELSDSRYYRQE
ncbi:MAG: hypothetical protein ACLR7J_04640 [[Ruminococcus] torques]